MKKNLILKRLKCYVSYGKTVLLVFCFNFAWSPCLHAQELKAGEDSLKRIAYDILHGNDDFVKLNASKSLATFFPQVLQERGAFDYDFDSLVSISHLYSPDHSFRIFTWAIPKNDGTYEFCGLIHMKEKGKIWMLNDASDEIQQPENQVLDCKTWYGALYYNILQNEYDGKKWYTLLGWDGNNSFSRKKLIEVLSFKASGQPVFGAAIFSHFPRAKVRRVIFEYSANTSMSLNYSEQLINIRSKDRKKKGKEQEIKKVPAELIVFDRLSPMDPQLEGQYQFYVPETNVYDAFRFEAGKWSFIKDVDARNLEWKSKAKKAKPDRNIFPPKID